MNLPSRNITLRIAEGKLAARLVRPPTTRTLIIVASTEESHVLDALVATLIEHGHAVLTIDLLTREEAHFNRSGGNAPLLAQRLITLLDFIRTDGDTEDLTLGIFALGHAAPAAIRAAAQRDAAIRAVAVHGGLIDHAGLEYLKALCAPLLVLPDEHDPQAEPAARRAMMHLSTPCEIAMAEGRIPTQVAVWFERWLSPRA